MIFVVVSTGVASLTTTLGLRRILLQSDKNELSVLGICGIKEVTGSITKRIAVGFAPDVSCIRTSGTSGGGTYGKYMYGGVALACARDNRDSCDCGQYYCHDH